MSNELNRYVETILKSAYRGNIYDNIPQNFLQYSEQGGKVILFLTPENYLAYKDSVTQLSKHFIDKYKGFSYKFFELLVRECLFADNEDILTYIENKIKGNPIREFVITRPLYGVNLERQQISRAEYKFISSIYLKEYLKQHYKNEISYKLFEVENLQTAKCYVEIRIKAREKEFAKVEADRRLQMLDNLLRVLSQNFDEFAGLGTLNFNTELVGGRICYDIKSGTSETSMEVIKHPLQPIQLDELILADNELWKKRLWSIYEKETLTWTEERIKKAVNWVGRSMNERDVELSFLQSLFALESLLQCQKGFIDKGLTAQMAENFAFIVAYKPEDRIKAESQFKDIYSLRSKLVHGESEKEIEAERDTAIAFALYALKNLLLKEEFLRLENEKEFKDLITNLKFGLR